MPVPSSDTAELKKTILEAAQAMLAGTLPYTEGADILIKTESLWGPGDDVSLCLHEVRMKTAHVPRIAFRHLWSPAVLQKQQPEFDRLEDWARSFAEGACRAVVARLAP